MLNWGVMGAGSCSLLNQPGLINYCSDGTEIYEETIPGYEEMGGGVTSHGYVVIGCKKVLQDLLSPNEEKIKKPNGNQDCRSGRCPCEWGLHTCSENMCCDYNYIFGGGCHEEGNGVYFDNYNNQHNQWTCSDKDPKQDYHQEL